MDASIVTAIGTLGETMAGGLITWVLNKQKIQSDIKQANLKRKWELEDKEKEQRKKVEDQKFEMYNRILMMAGNTIVVTQGNVLLKDNSRSLSFNFKAYEDIIRPLLF